MSELRKSKIRSNYESPFNSFFKAPNWLQNVSRQAVMLYILSYADKELSNSLFKAPNWLKIVRRKAVILQLLSYADKELTNSLLLASDWLTISVYVIWFDKVKFKEKSENMTSKIPLLLQILVFNPYAGD